VFADVADSATLISCFPAEWDQPGHSAVHESRAAIIVALALAVVAVVLTVESITALASVSRPSTWAITSIAA
jgi:hypothetical protein